ncbi:MAG: thermonuclease family protein [Candidatus Moraniibacteriota bacterium]
MIALRRMLRKKMYQVLLTGLLFGALWYQKETGILPEWRVPDAIPGSTVAVRVTRVIDGDTFEIEGGERVRLIGIDTPESVKPNTPVECYAVESSEYLKTLIEGKMVRLERDRTDRDRYARLLRYVYLGDVFINEFIVREGYAESVSYRPDTARQATLDEAERQAKAESKGRWGMGTCP